LVSLREELMDDIADPERAIRHIKESSVPADILTFTEHLPDLTPRYAYHVEWDNLAVLPVTTHEEWLRHQVHKNTRKLINKVERLGVRVEARDLDADLVSGMMEIFNETPVRRGRRYPYYGRDADTVAREWSPDLHRSQFLAAYYQEEIIGFIKLILGEDYARASGTIAKVAHRDKSPMNAMLSKAVMICAERHIPYLIYGKYVYGNKGEDSLTDFKRHNGFERFDVPRYYVPLTLRGRVAIALGLHHSPSELLPGGVVRILSRARSAWNRGARAKDPA